jgi:formylglycine-generating enzyme required for sulfatase activity
VVIPAGEFLLGEDSHWAYDSDGESPVVRARVEAFALDRHPVTVEQFAAFVAATGYRSEAERYGWSFVFGGHLPHDFPDTRAVASAPWWRVVEGSCWIAPEGPGSSVEHRAEHPVVHVSWNDALAYCTWTRSRLPGEAEWERAARAGTHSTFPWGDELEPDGRHMANVFQGRFPDHDTAEDGWAGTSPVGSFPANNWGLVDMIGNVWEWTADAFSVPRGGSGSDRVLKGGSHLCHVSYCHRYRPAARLGNAPNTSTSHIGFRTAAV